MINWTQESVYPPASVTNPTDFQPIIEAPGDASRPSQFCCAEDFDSGRISNSYNTSFLGTSRSAQQSIGCHMDVTGSQLLNRYFQIAGGLRSVKFYRHRCHAPGALVEVSALRVQHMHHQKNWRRVCAPSLYGILCAYAPRARLADSPSSNSEISEPSHSAKLHVAGRPDQYPDLRTDDAR